MGQNSRAAGVPEDVHQALLKIAAGQTDDEVRLRVSVLQHPISARIRPTGREDLVESIARARAELDGQLGEIGEEDLTAAWAAAQDQVQRIIDEDRQLEAFRGKPIFEVFFDRHAKHAGMARKIFAHAVAGRAANFP